MGSRTLFYNRYVNNVNITEIHNVYNTTVVYNNDNHVSYNGGNGGINERPTPQEEAAAHERHIRPVAAQTQHIQAARSNPQLRASANMGKPPVAATPRPGEFKGSVVAAREAGGKYTPPANRGGATVPGMKRARETVLKTRETVLKTMVADPTPLRMFAIFRLQNGRARRIPATPSKTRNTSSSRKSYMRSSNRNGKKLLSSSRRKISGWRSRMPMKLSSNKPNSGTSNRRSNYSKGINSSSSKCSREFSRHRGLRPSRRPNLHTRIAIWQGFRFSTRSLVRIPSQEGKA